MAPQPPTDNQPRAWLWALIVLSSLLAGMGMVYALVSPSAVPPADFPEAGVLPWIEVVWALWVFTFGACIGSFLNVVAYRMPLGISIVAKPSYCPKCETKIRFRDNVPIFGWLMLRGRCRKCGLAISARYPVVEFATAWCFLAVYVGEIVIRASAAGSAEGGVIGLFVSHEWYVLGQLAMHLFLVSALMAIVLIEIDGQHVPPRFRWFCIVVGLVVTCLWPAAYAIEWYSLGALNAVDASSWPLWPTGIAGLLAGAAMAVGSRKAGVGDSQLPSALTMTGLFGGWQVVAVVAAVAVAGARIWMTLQPGSRPVRPTVIVLITVVVIMCLV
ncbi:MAG: prepilin peptidase [Planctomycetales bacterium]|nr:prepilin peptidase [Planctomycetales bacterium]